MPRTHGCMPDAGPFTRHVNYLGLCAASVPTGPIVGDVSSPVLPTSLAIVCRPNEEVIALAIAKAYEGARGELTKPPMAKLCDIAHDTAPASE